MSSILGGQCPHVRGGMRGSCEVVDLVNWLLGIWSKSEVSGQIGGPNYDNLAKNPKISIIWGVWSKTPKKHVYLGVEIRGLGRIWTPEIVKKVTISDPLKMRTLASKDRRNQLADKDLM